VIVAGDIAEQVAARAEELMETESLVRKAIGRG
jgi:hypothetical protein